jgi:hypothetical protein
MAALRHTRRWSLRPREREAFEALTETFCGPRPPFPSVADTDATAFIERLAGGSPLQNRIGFRLLLRSVEVGPRLRGFGASFSKLPPERRAEFLRGLDKSRWLLLRVGARLLKTLTVMAYYGDAGVLRATGYDADWNVRRGRELRAARNKDR